MFMAAAFSPYHLSFYTNIWMREWDSPGRTAACAFTPGTRTGEKFVALNPVRVGRQTFSFVEEKRRGDPHEKRPESSLFPTRKIHEACDQRKGVAAAEAISPTPRADSPAGLAQRTRRRRSNARRGGRPVAAAVGGTRAALSRWHWHKRVAPPQAPPGKKKDSVLLEGGKIAWTTPRRSNHVSASAPAGSVGSVLCGRTS